MTVSDAAPMVEGIEESGASPKKGNSIRPLLRLLIRKSWLMMIVAGLTGAAGYASSMSKSSSYQANFYLLVEPITAAAKLTDPTTLTREDPSSGVPSESPMALDYPTNLAFLQSPGMTYRIAQEVNRQLPKKSVPAIWKDLRDSFKVQWIRAKSGKDATKIFEVSYQGENPKEVETVLTIAAETFVKYSAEDRQTSIKAGLKFIASQLPSLEKRLDALKAQQQKIRERYSLVDPSTKNESLLAQIAGLSNQKSTLEQQLMAQITLAKSLEKQLKTNPSQALAAAVLNQDQERLSLIKQIQELDAQIATSQAIFTDESLQIINLKQKRDNLQQLLKARTQSLLDTLPITFAPSSANVEFQDPTRLRLIEQLLEGNNQIQSLKGQLFTIDKQLKRLRTFSQIMPQVINQFNIIDRNIKLTESVLDKLLLQRQTLQVEASQNLPWQLISKPQIPLDAKGKPIGEPPDKKKPAIMGAIAGLVISGLLLILWEKIRNRFACAEDIQDILAISLVGVVPTQSKFILTKNLAGKVKTPFNLAALETLKETQESSVNSVAPLFPLVRQLFDEMYMELDFFYQQNPLRSILISGIQPGDGQSMIALNLAIAAAKKKKRVLLVDGHLQEPQLHRLLGVKNEKGLSDFLEQELPLEAVIQTVPDYKHLFLISGGNYSPDLCLWSDNFELLMSKINIGYDLVIYDLPHFSDSQDVYFIAARVDALILAISVNKTPQSLAKETIRKANDFRLPVIGAIANFA